MQPFGTLHLPYPPRPAATNAGAPLHVISPILGGFNIVPARGRAA
jgi:hypothetical protein